MTTTSGTGATPLQSICNLVVVLAGGVVTLALILYKVLDSGDFSSVWVPWTLGGFAVTSHLLSRTKGFNLRPVPPGTLPQEAMAMSRTAFHASSLLRLVLSESVAIIALVLSFAVLPASWMTYLIGAVMTLILLGVNVWPSPAVISRAQQRLERDGGQSFLHDALLGLAPGTTASGTIRG